MEVHRCNVIDTELSSPEILQPMEFPREVKFQSCLNIRNEKFCDVRLLYAGITPKRWTSSVHFFSP
jgi:hypothetical protein